MPFEDTHPNSLAELVRVAGSPPLTGKDRLLYPHLTQLDQDADLGFELRGLSLNPMVDAAQPLLGLVIRLRRLQTLSPDDVTALYHSVRDQITTIDNEMAQLGYERGARLSFSYALCAFIDEAVMATPWGGGSSPWSERSLLSHHHHETWGGEKFFAVLSRMLADPAKYQHVLEFKYLCLCLGFQGMYGRPHSLAESLDSLILNLHRVLRELRGPAPEPLTDARANVADRKTRVARQWPLWSPWVVALVAAMGVYALFEADLAQSTEQVLQSLNDMLKP